MQNKLDNLQEPMVVPRHTINIRTYCCPSEFVSLISVHVIKKSAGIAQAEVREIRIFSECPEN